jgi:hypothetical protein
MTMDANSGVPRCLDCKHVELIPNNLESGVCHLDPPDPIVAGAGPQGPVMAMIQRTVRLTKDYCSHFVFGGIIQAKHIPFPEK